MTDGADAARTCGARLELVGGVTGSSLPRRSSCGDRCTSAISLARRPAGGVRHPGLVSCRCVGARVSLRELNGADHGHGARQHADRHGRRAASCATRGSIPAYFASWFPFPGQLAARLGDARRRRLPVRVAPAPGPLRRRAPASGSSARRRPCCCRSTRPASSRTSCASWASPASSRP